jgi:uncharacterized protein Usg
LPDATSQPLTCRFEPTTQGTAATGAVCHRRPDHPWLLQTYIWQAYYLCPEFPELQGFLEFWQKSLEGVLHSITVAHSNRWTGCSGCIDQRPGFTRRYVGPRRLHFPGVSTTGEIQFVQPSAARERPTREIKRRPSTPHVFFGLVSVEFSSQRDHRSLN